MTNVPPEIENQIRSDLLFFKSLVETCIEEGIIELTVDSIVNLLFDFTTSDFEKYKDIQPKVDEKFVKYMQEEFTPRPTGGMIHNFKDFSKVDDETALD